MVFSATSKRDRTRARDFAIEAARLLEDRHCEDVVVLDVHGLSQVCDYLIISSGTSDRQMKSVAAELEDLASERGEKVFRCNRDTGVTWIVIDFVDVVAHLFEPNQRAYYDLEDLWADAPQVSWERNGESATATPAGKGPRGEGEEGDDAA